MMGRKKRVFIVAAAVGFYALNRFARRWGATDVEVAETYPGDNIVPNRFVETTHAVTISAPADC